MTWRYRAWTSPRRRSTGTTPRRESPASRYPARRRGHLHPAVRRPRLDVASRRQRVLDVPCQPPRLGAPRVREDRVEERPHVGQRVPGMLVLARGNRIRLRRVARPEVVRLDPLRASRLERVEVNRYEDVASPVVRQRGPLLQREGLVPLARHHRFEPRGHQQPSQARRDVERHILFPEAPRSTCPGCPPRVRHR